MRIEDILARARALSEDDVLKRTPKASVPKGAKVMHDFGPLTDPLARRLLVLERVLYEELREKYADADMTKVPRDELYVANNVRAAMETLKTLLQHELGVISRATLPEQYRGMEETYLAFGEDWHVLLLEPPKRRPIAVMIGGGDLLSMLREEASPTRQ